MASTLGQIGIEDTGFPEKSPFLTTFWGPESTTAKIPDPAILAVVTTVKMAGSGGPCAHGGWSGGWPSQVPGIGFALVFKGFEPGPVPHARYHAQVPIPIPGTVPPVPDHGTHHHHPGTRPWYPPLHHTRYPPVHTAAWPCRILAQQGDM